MNATGDGFTLIIAVSGRRLCWPGVCSSKNGWTIPPKRHQVADIVGHACFEVLRFEAENGEHVWGVDTKNGEIYRVRNVLTPTLDKNTFGYSLDECADEENTIYVTIGDAPIMVSAGASVEHMCERRTKAYTI